MQDEEQLPSSLCGHFSGSCLQGSPRQSSDAGVVRNNLVPLLKQRDQYRPQGFEFQHDALARYIVQEIHPRHRSLQQLAVGRLQTLQINLQRLYSSSDRYHHRQRYSSA
ncbi:hypothetical protein SNK04_14606 [Fusarium graminearum]